MIRDDDGQRGDRSETDTDVSAFGPELVGTYDEVGDRPAYVIAELDRDEAWMAVPAGAEIELDEWE